MPEPTVGQAIGDEKTSTVRFKVCEFAHYSQRFRSGANRQRTLEMLNALGCVLFDNPFPKILSLLRDIMSDVGILPPIPHKCRDDKDGCGC